MVENREDVVKSKYEILGVSPQSSLEQIHRAYREKAKLLHPDTEGGNTAAFQELQQAYQDILKTHSSLLPPPRVIKKSTGGPARPIIPRMRPEPLIPRPKTTEPPFGKPGKRPAFTEPASAAPLAEILRILNRFFG